MVPEQDLAGWGSTFDQQYAATKPYCERLRRLLREEQVNASLDVAESHVDRLMRRTRPRLTVGLPRSYAVCNSVIIDHYGSSSSIHERYIEVLVVAPSQAFARAESREDPERDASSDYDSAHFQNVVIVRSKASAFACARIPECTQRAAAILGRACGASRRSRPSSSGRPRPRLVRRER